MTSAEFIVHALTERGLTIACAETLTGGGIAQALIQVPGSSRVLDLGVAAYSDQAKVKVLRIDSETIQRYGAVSEEIAREMAEGVATVAHADLGLAVTGVSGPGGGTAEKPVGMVCFALKKPGETITQTCRFGDLVRDAIMDRSVQTALELVEEYIKQ